MKRGRKDETACGISVMPQACSFPYHVLQSESLERSRNLSGSQLLHDTGPGYEHEEWCADNNDYILQQAQRYPWVHPAANLPAARQCPL